jgi:hypothetical protein
MKIITNDKKIGINRKIGSYTMIAGMITLVGGLIISINQIVSSSQNPLSPPTNSEAMFNYSTIAMFAGLLLTEISMYYNNRWGRKPSLDEKISLSLKGLDDKYAVYHYRGPVPTLVVGPSGIWILEAMYQHGTITYEKGRYHQAGITWFVRVFYQEGIGRPDLMLQNRIDDLKRFIKKNLPDAKLPPIQAAIVFTAHNAIVQVGEDAPFPVIHADKLKDFIRRKAKEQPVTSAEIKPLISALPSE